VTDDLLEVQLFLAVDMYPQKTTDAFKTTNENENVGELLASQKYLKKSVFRGIGIKP
jgi:hypothetical protein